VSRNWKPVERELARILGGERVPVSGRTRGYAPDIEHPWLALEIKSRKNLPLFLANGMDQAEKAAAWAKRRQDKDKLPCLISHQDGRHYDNAVISFRLKDWLEWWGPSEDHPSGD
jgi:Holliday junction resolvase